jgi:hypothetical protein
LKEIENVWAWVATTKTTTSRGVEVATAVNQDPRYYYVYDVRTK